MTTVPAAAAPTTAESDAALLQVRGVTSRFEGTTALDAVDLDVARGEFLAVRGASGSGKSTLLHVLSGLARPGEGSVRSGGVELTGSTARQLARHRLLDVGFVFQQVHLLGSLTLLDNVVLPGYQARREPRPTVLARARGLLDTLGIAELAERGVGEASGGELQRTGIARALINRPALLLADEPTGALDSASSRAVMEELDRISAQGTTIILVTHDLEVASHGHRVITMADGRIVGAVELGERSAPGDPEEIFRRAEQLRVATGQGPAGSPRQPGSSR